MIVYFEDTWTNGAILNIRYFESSKRFTYVKSTRSSPRLIGLAIVGRRLGCGFRAPPSYFKSRSPEFVDWKICWLEMISQPYIRGSAQQVFLVFRPPSALLEMAFLRACRSLPWIFSQSFCWLLNPLLVALLSSGSRAQPPVSFASCKLLYHHPFFDLNPVLLQSSLHTCSRCYTPLGYQRLMPLSIIQTM